MPTLDALIERLPDRPDPGELLAGFVPPPRFAEKRFEDYVPDPRFPSQRAAVERLRGVAASLHAGSLDGWMRRVRAVVGRGTPRGGGTYLDGGFGVGKTHLLAALWNAAPEPRAYLSFDELVYTIGLLGVGGTREAFRGRRLVAVDEWELDDPGNLKLALAFLRGALEDGVHVATTSNTVPDELGHGRFSQKDFRAEIEELASAFEVVRVQGEDYRHRHFEADPGRRYFLPREAVLAAARAAGPGALHAGFPELLSALGRVHPIRYAALAARMDALFVDGLRTVPTLPDALRWVHFVDKVYDDAVPFAASSETDLGALFPAEFLRGPYGKKFSRCLSRMEELLGEQGGAERRAAG
ncbi:MAG TPA: cell division protein ZapE [Longimicrobiaceae bacterium]|nr:cell division protein ZapE [Longimicrobiaceae bacterium]